nr:YDG domain-containing protein At5g47150-like isoform X2 [Erigeron canadensis]
MAANPVRPKKRQLDDDMKLGESEKHKKPVSGLKKRTGVHVIRDFPPGCGVIKTVSGKMDRGPLKRLENVDPKVGKATKPDRKKDVFGLRPVGNVKVGDATFAAKKVEDVRHVVISEKERVRREKIQEAMKLFNEVYDRMFLENKVKEKGEKIAHWRVPGEAAKVVKDRVKWVDFGKVLGPLCGVQVGDKFRFRSQLQMVGLHCQPQAGIDYTQIKGKILAISIVDSNSYSNERESGDVLFYSGQGGLKFLGNKEVLPEDQKLEKGNLALKNSMNEKNVVRVIRKVQEVGRNGNAFVYDGLYLVNNFTQEKGTEGNMVFMFQLNRVPGQPPFHKFLKG